MRYEIYMKQYISFMKMEYAWDTSSREFIICGRINKKDK